VVRVVFYFGLAGVWHDQSTDPAVQVFQLGIRKSCNMEQCVFAMLDHSSIENIDAPSLEMHAPSCTPVDTEGKAGRILQPVQADDRIRERPLLAQGWRHNLPPRGESGHLSTQVEIGMRLSPTPILRFTAEQQAARFSITTCGQPSSPNAIESSTYCTRAWATARGKAESPRHRYPDHSRRLHSTGTRPQCLR
jgi:hypothetical protein